MNHHTNLKCFHSVVLCRFWGSGRHTNCPWCNTVEFDLWPRQPLLQDVFLLSFETSRSGNVSIHRDLVSCIDPVVLTTYPMMLCVSQRWRSRHRFIYIDLSNQYCSGIFWKRVHVPEDSFPVIPNSFLRSALKVFVFPVMIWDYRLLQSREYLSPRRMLPEITPLKV